MKQKYRFMDWRFVVIVALLAAGGLWLWYRQPAGKEVDETPTEGSEQGEVVRRRNPKPPKVKEDEGGEVKEDSDDSDSEKVDEEPAMTEENADSADKEPEPEMTEEEKRAERDEALVNAFDDLTDEWREPADSDVPMAEVDKFRQQFNKIPNDRKEECLQRALNLLPDENIMLLAGILTDKEQPREYLELVFNDILNRDESVKKPLLELIYKDKEHPCWATTAWIFDATGETPEK